MKSQYVLPITIVVAGALIAGAVFLAGKAGSPTTGNNTDGKVTDLRPYTPGVDHILGNPNAEVKVIEYMDLECPHCKTFNTTMHQVMDYYGTSGKVAWVQRPFPLAQLHSKAPQEAHAAECAAEQGGDTAYFAYTDKIFEITPSSNGLDLAQLPVIAQQVGLNVETFNTCMTSGRHNEKIQASYNEAVAAGAQGTPYTLLMVGGESVVLPGSQPYDSMRAAIDAVLGNLGGAAGTVEEGSQQPLTNPESQ
jgi:protein-disulfide isomerase